MPPLFWLHPKIPRASPIEIGDGDLNAESMQSLRARVTRWWRFAHAAGDDALGVSLHYAAFIDDLIRTLVEQSDRAEAGGGTLSSLPIAVMALGGYGRCEMGPHSDIDLLFLHEGGDEARLERVTSAILYPLWDAGFEVGGATRTIEDCRRVVGSDVRALTSMLDARFVAGDRAVAERFQAFITGWFSSDSVRRNFVCHKLDEQRTRRTKFSDSIYLLQPNVKEGEGGLRDFHTLVWLTRAAYQDGPLDTMFLQAGLSERSVQALARSVAFLWRVRHALHLMDGKRQDRLSEIHQDTVADMLGFKDSTVSSASEKLMQAYYEHAAIIHRRAQWIFERMEQRWSGLGQRVARALSRWPIERGVMRYGRAHMAITDDALERDPSLMLRAFVYAKRQRLVIDADSKERIEGHVHRIDDALRSSEGVRMLWAELFKSPDYLGPIISEMHECKCLEHWFPEMRPMMYRIQHDGFHVYTVDVHTIHALSELSCLVTRAGRHAHRTAAEAMRALKRPHVMLLATLLHDVGKGYEGDHVSVGAGLAPAIVARLGFSLQDQEEVSFLVKSHMLMPKLAFHRDVRDPSLIERFARVVRTPQMLAMLYLMTFADLKSVGPHVWSTWKEGLLNDLYERTRDYLIAGGQTEEHHQRIAARHVRAASRLLGRRVSSDELTSFVATMPKRYALAMSGPIIASHFSMVRKLTDEKPLLCDVRNDHDRGLSQLLIVTRDAPGLFAKIAGILAAQSLNIIDADLYTTSAGQAVDIIRVTDLKHQPIEDGVRWRRVMAALEQIGDPARLDKMFRRATRTSLKRRRSRGEPRVEVDNDVSAVETVVEIHADDQPGLLHRIASVVAQYGCTIDRARIATHVDRVVDVFYIRDSGGKKITSLEHLAGLRNALLGELAP